MALLACTAGAVASVALLVAAVAAAAPSASPLTGTGSPIVLDAGDFSIAIDGQGGHCTAQLSLAPDVRVTGVGPRSVVGGAARVVADAVPFVQLYNKCVVKQAHHLFAWPPNSATGLVVLAVNSLHVSLSH
jgi:hypothetical protein